MENQEVKPPNQNLEIRSPPFLSYSEMEERDRRIKKAAVEGDVDTLIKCIKADSKKPVKRYLWIFPCEEDNYDFNSGNIFHLAARNNQEEFIKKILEIDVLPLTEKKQLLLQPMSEENKWNPLHAAAYYGYLEIVKIFVEFYTPLSPDDSEKPWLKPDEEGKIACFTAIDGSEEECAMELLKMDTQVVCNKTSDDGSSLLYSAVYSGLDALATEILNSSIPFSTSGYKGNTPLHCIPRWLDEEEGKRIIELLLHKVPGIIEEKNSYGGSILHSWAEYFELWPFQCLLDSEVVLQDIDVRTIFAKLVAAPNNNNSNPLHRLVSHKQRTDKSLREVAELLVKTYKNEESRLSNTTFPWLMVNKRGHTPFSLAIEHKYEEFAMYMLDVDENVLNLHDGNALLLKAVKRERTKLVKKILDMIKADDHKWHHLLINEEEKTTILHVAPSLDKDEALLKRLLEEHLDLLDVKDRGDNNILHYWLSSKGAVWQLELLLKNDDWKKKIIKFVDQANKDQKNNPFHVAANSTRKDISTYVKLLVTAYIEDKKDLIPNDFKKLPWFQQNKEKEGPLELAIKNKNEDLAVYILSLYDKEKLITKLLNYYYPKQIILLAVENQCYKLADDILKRLDGLQRWDFQKHLLKPSGDKRSIMHLASGCEKEDQQFYAKHLLERAKKWVPNKKNNDDKKQKEEENEDFENKKDEESKKDEDINEKVSLLTKKDDDEITPLEKAFERGATWFVKEYMEKYPDEYDKEFLAWIKACKNGKVSTMEAIINKNPKKFRYLCVKYKVSPLHHIKLDSLWDYEKFLDIKLMNKELLNIRDEEGDTPLHKAIRDDNKLLTQTLLSMKEIKCDIKGKIDDEDKDWEKNRKWKSLQYFFRNIFTLSNDWDVDDERRKTAKELLQDKCRHKKDEHRKDHKDWKAVCEYVRFDPNLTTSYVEGQANLVDVRTSLFVVAALLATITFTAGFTLPGGLDDETGLSMMATRTSFFVFLISNTFAMLNSMLVLICLVYSMVSSSEKSNQSLKLIDRSLQMLLLAFYSTVLAFVTGVYLVVSKKVYWLAVVVIVMCGMIGISMGRKLLFKVLLIPSVNKDYQNVQKSQVKIDVESPSIEKDDDTEDSNETTEVPASTDSEEEDSEGDSDESNEEDSEEEEEEEEEESNEELSDEEEIITRDEVPMRNN